MTRSMHSTQQPVQGRSTILYALFTLVFIAMAGLLASPVMAGAGKGHHKRTPAEKLDKLTKKLSLTDEQRAAILPILEDKRQKMKALHNQMKEVRQNAMAQVEAQLTPEQQEKFKKAREKRQRKMEKYRDGHGKKGEKGKHGKKHKRGHGKNHDDDDQDEDLDDDDDHSDDDDDDDDHEKKKKKGKRGKGRH